MSKYYAQFKNVNVGQTFICNGTTYTKINGRMAKITEPLEAYDGKSFYFAMAELCQLCASG